MRVIEKPGPHNRYLGEHAELLIGSYRHWTGKDLVKQEAEKNLPQVLFEAPYGVVSHDTEDDPVFNYGNQTALRLFAMEWAEFTRLPSRKSAEPVNRAERDRLLARVTRHGFIDDYRGIRISATGKRFSIEEATVWNILDAGGRYRGQAAVFYKWSEL